jgi:hypothetical protein
MTARAETMLRRQVRLLGWLLVSLLASGVPTLGGAPPEPGSQPISAAEFNKILKELHVKNQPWATIPWKVSLTEARRLAAAERKPIFLVVNTGNCLGWT